jgi:hypothetical protein
MDAVAGGVLPLRVFKSIFFWLYLMMNHCKQSKTKQKQTKNKSHFGEVSPQRLILHKILILTKSGVTILNNFRCLPYCEVRVMGSFTLAYQTHLLLLPTS